MLEKMLTNMLECSNTVNSAETIRRYEDNLETSFQVISETSY